MVVKRVIILAKCENKANGVSKVGRILSLAGTKHLKTKGLVNS